MPSRTCDANPLLNALREHTRDSHKALEARLPFFAPSFDTAAYRRLLEAYYGFHAPLQEQLHEHQGPERSKIPTLRRDLQALGLTQTDVEALPICQALPVIDGPPAALGVMYVLEGSTLGGQVLKRAMAERLGLDAENGCAFLDVYGPLTGSHWRSFLERLAHASVFPADQAVTVKAAVDTFRLFERWLAHCDVLLAR
ncbi:biliverdin-producing heme oxygenase [Pseudomonas sp.]|uniref:biliverdin-producing heme oxygenase n=1 Tax=Pseudomonas sp. TaxID=306 RepID=UPI0028A7CA9A|nr:biliverdin-producing heme oxygenase [Pseudomonas sp.]